MKINSNIGLNRRSDLRCDQNWHAARLGHAASRFMILVDLRPTIISNKTRTETLIRWFTSDEIFALGLAPTGFMFLGINDFGHGHYFMALRENEAKVLKGAAEFLMPNVDLRSLADQDVMSAADMSLIGAARSLAAWHASHRYCGHCGSGNEILDLGWRAQCGACGEEHFPRMDPVVIMLVTHGEKCLLARDVRFPETLYSTLAGFLEPGEDIEVAVRREVFEEVGLVIDAVDYQCSQPWPFPHSLMLGCRAEASATELKLDGNEIADAFWVDKFELQQLLEGSEQGKIDLPQDFAIANKLMRDFINEK